MVGVKLGQKIEKELCEPVLVYGDVTLTDNYIVFGNVGDDGFEAIKYKDVVWIYVGEYGSFVSNLNIERVLSLATGDKKGAKINAVTNAAIDSARDMLSVMLVGVPRLGYHTVMIVFSKDNRFVSVMDKKVRMLGGVKRAFDGKMRCGKEFETLFGAIVDRCPEGVMVGAEYEDAYCDMMGIDMYKSDDDSLGANESDDDEYDDV